MNLIKDFAEKHDGYYEEENIKNIFSHLGRMVYQPKTAKFLITGSRISINLDEVGGAIPTAEPYRITLHLNKKSEESLEIYPISFLERIIQKLLPSRNKKFKNKYVFKGNEAFISQMVNDALLIKKLQQQKVYVRIPKENRSKLILTPPHGIESAEQLEILIEVLKNIEEKIMANDLRRNY